MIVNATLQVVWKYSTDSEGIKHVGVYFKSNEGEIFIVGGEADKEEEAALKVLVKKLVGNDPAFIVEIQ